MFVGVRCRNRGNEQAQELLHT